MTIDPLKDFPGYLLHRVSADAMTRLARRLAPLGLRPTEASVLLVIEANPNITQSEIGRMLDIAGANMAPLVARLADRELIEREPVDGRSHGLTLAPAGRELFVQLRNQFKEHEAEILDKLPASRRAAFTKMLRTLWYD